MNTPIKNLHADLSGSILPENPLSPATEGHPLWPPLTLDEDTAATLKAITAVLTRQTDACKEMGLLPIGYYGEDCDFEESESTTGGQSGDRA